jgi:hypothetical protein
MIKYFDLGAGKKLNEIVMAGSHDAGIMSGGVNVQTQDLDIGGQAAAGVRVFDLRVAAAAAPGQGGGPKEAKLVAFHADSKLMKNETKSRYMPDVGRTETITRTKLSGGAFGAGLVDMLQQARSFVKTYGSEFLILKFDKCKNWELIAEACVTVLGDAIYKGNGNLNTTSLGTLAGKVVCLFTDSGLAAVPHQYRMGGGILGIRNLYAGGTYTDSYAGMQYFGKGGTSVAQPFGKLAQNQKKQSKLMSKGAATDPDVMGMMYWTTTGLNESIRKRNEGMWSPKNVNKLRALWENGLAESIESRIAKHVDPTSYSSAQILKAFMPNIVMIDFADEYKCAQIYDLNRVAATELTYAARMLDLDVKRVQEQYAQLERQGRV